MTTTLVSNGLVPEYPKIETIFNRDPVNMKRVIFGAYRLPEFEAVNRWRVTEKIDGTNVRVAVMPDGTVFYGGRTDAAQVPPHLMEHLRATFTLEALRRGVNESSEVVTLYGEGYGLKIQSGGNYRKSGVAFRLFDVRVGNIWLDWQTVNTIATKIGVNECPMLGTMTTEQAIGMVKQTSITAREDGGDSSFVHEGVVCRSEPLMLTRMGERVMWKLKVRDLK